MDEQLQTVVELQKWARSAAATARASLNAHREGHWPLWRVIVAQREAAHLSRLAREAYEVARG